MPYLTSFVQSRYEKLCAGGHIFSLAQNAAIKHHVYFDCDAGNLLNHAADRVSRDLIED